MGNKLSNIASTRNEEIEEVIDKATRLGLTTELRIRNLRIRQDFLESCKSNTRKDSIAYLSGKYFLDIKTLEGIVYQK